MGRLLVFRTDHQYVPFARVPIPGTPLTELLRPANGFRSGEGRPQARDSAGDGWLTFDLPPDSGYTGALSQTMGTMIPPDQDMGETEA